MRLKVDVQAERLMRVLRLKVHEVTEHARRERAGRRAKWAARREALWAALPSREGPQT
jgi:hypothetical protein